MRNALRALVVGAALVAAGLAPASGLAQEQDQNQDQGQVGGLVVDAGGSDNITNSAAGQSGERTVISRDPGVTSANNAGGEGNREAVRDDRRAARAAERAAAPEVAPAAPAPVAADPAPVPDVAAAPAAAPAPGAPAAGGRTVTALPDTGTGIAGQVSAALALVLAGLAAAGASVIARRAQRA